MTQGRAFLHFPEGKKIHHHGLRVGSTDYKPAEPGQKEQESQERHAGLAGQGCPSQGCPSVLPPGRAFLLQTTLHNSVLHLPISRFLSLVVQS